MSNLKKLRLSKSCIGKAEKKAVMKVLDRGYFGMGQEVKEFEDNLTEFFERPAVCVVNGTAALQLALQAAGIGNGDEVLVQSLTYVASFQAIKAAGAIPVACDIDPITLSVDLNDVKNKITSKTKAIMPVHYAGGVGDLDALYLFATSYKLRVIEDAAHAFGTKYKDNKVGSFGDICCFSFDGIKNITSGEGGCIVTSDENVLKNLKDIRLLGVENDTDSRFSGNRTWDPDVKVQGWRYHMSDLMAAIGKEQLRNFEYHKSQRQLLAKCYLHHLKKIPSIKTVKYNYDEVVPHIFVVQLPENIERESLREYLDKNDIPTGIHYKPNHLLTYFKRKNQDKILTTEKLYPRLLTLPLHPELNEDDIRTIVDILDKGIQHA
ncbi:DegT/DnrJ/EryC1/StrS family aminotransferase [Gammaproteobacteria bacterium]|nr:DegT/DnrJ/EryC1/StrS family aminotransferase [Gammaproteobacteria bacterium]